MPRIFRGISAAVPYANMVMLNVVQIGIIIFLASDFFKRDRKLNTSEVYYIRSMTNATYLSGKENDFSAFGVNLSEWQHLALKVEEKEFKFYLNHTETFSGTYENTIGDIIGVGFFCNSFGEIDFINLTDKNNIVIFEDDFQE